MQALQPLPAESTAAKQALTTAQPRNQADGGSFADLQQGPPGNMASAALPQPAQTKYTEQDASAAGGVFASQALSDKQFDNTIEDKTTPAYQSDSLGQCTDRTSSFAMPCATKTPESSAITAACSLASVAMEDECQSSGSTDKLQMCGIYHHAQSALIFFKTLKKRLTGADLQCLQDASAITQLFVLSAFAAELKADRKPAVFVRTTWRRLCADGVSVNPALILQTGQSVFAKSIVHLLARAWKAGVFEKRYIQSRVEAKLKCLPRSLHWAAACYAIGVLLEMSNSQQALPVLEAGIDQMQQVLVDARPA